MNATHQASSSPKTYEKNVDTYQATIPKYYASTASSYSKPQNHFHSSTYNYSTMPTNKVQYPQLKANKYNEEDTTPMQKQSYKAYKKFYNDLFGSFDDVDDYLLSRNLFWIEFVHD